MTSTSSESDFQYWRESSSRFDHLITGTIAATVAYISQNLRAARIGPNPATVELAALLVLLVSLYVSFRRHEKVIARDGSEVVRQRLWERGESSRLAARRGGGQLIEEGRELTVEALNQRADAYFREAAEQQRFVSDMAWSAGRLYRVRTWTLVGGLGMLIGARVLAAYRL